MLVEATDVSGVKNNDAHSGFVQGVLLTFHQVCSKVSSQVGALTAWWWN